MRAFLQYLDSEIGQWRDTYAARYKQMHLRFTVNFETIAKGTDDAQGFAFFGVCKISCIRPTVSKTISIIWSLTFEMLKGRLSFPSHVWSAIRA